jgi:transcription initiation factor TFIID subunit 6
MVKSLLENQTLFLEKYLHELIPAVTTCIVARQLCTRPDVDNHWALRDFASRLMANICKNFNTSTNNIQTRVTRMFCEALKADRTPLVSFYGAIAGLQELGPEVIKVFILPHIHGISSRIEQANDPNNTMSANPNIEKIAATHIRNLVIKSVAPVMRSVRSPNDTPEDYKNDYGALGPLLLVAVQRTRSTGSATQGPLRTAATAVPPAGAQQVRPQMVHPQGGAGPPRYVMVSSTPNTPQGQGIE